MVKTLKVLPPHMQEAVLDVVRHSSEEIDTLIHKLHNRLRRGFVVGDEVNFEADNKVIKGEISAVQSRSTPLKITLADESTGSPSSDKENDFVAADKADNIKYSVKVNDKTVCSIPHHALSRVKALPSDEAIKKFVLTKANYVSGSATSAGRWTIKSQAKKRKLTSPTESTKKTKATKNKPVQKNTLDAFVKITRISKDATGVKTDKTPTKVATPVQKATPTSSKKRKTPNKSPSQNNVSMTSTLTNHKRSAVIDITDFGSDISVVNHKIHRNVSKQKEKTPGKSSTAQEITRTPTSGGKRRASSRSPAVKPDRQVVIDKCSSQRAAEKSVAVSKSPAKAAPPDSAVLLPTASKTAALLPAAPRAAALLPAASKSPAAMPIVINIANSSLNKPLSPVKLLQTSASAAGSSTMPIVVPETNIDDKGNQIITLKQLHIGHYVGTSSGQQGNKKPPSLLKSGSVVMRQLTLFDLAKASSSTAADGFASVTPPTPKVVRKYRKAVKEDNVRMKNQCVLIAAKQLTESQRTLLPSPMKTLVLQKIEFLENRDKMKNMTEEEKRLLRPQQQIQKADDLELTTSRPLPPAQEITLPGDFPISSLNDLLFVTQFLVTFKSFLTKPESVKYQSLTFDVLASYLSSKDDIILEIMMSLLHTLLNDFTLSEASEMGIPLNDISINRNTLFQLLHLTFTMTSQKSERSQLESDELKEMAMAIGRHTREDIPALTQLSCLKTLCTLLLDTQGILIYQEDIQKKAASCWTGRATFMKSYVDFTNTHGLKAPVDNMAREESGASTPIMVVEEAQSVGDALRLRREISKRSAEEREKKQAELQKQKEMENEKLHMEQQKLDYEDNLKAAIFASAVSKRLSPLGMDRNYSRYWLLPGHQGIYVEMGWANDLHHSHVQPDLDSEPFLVPQSSAYGWYHYADKQAVDALMDSLNQDGLREHSLWARLSKNYQQIIFKPRTRPQPEEKKDQTEVSVLDSFREELLNLEDRVRSGGLGGVADYDVWSESLEKATTTMELGKLLLECQGAVYENKRSGVMALPSERRKKDIKPRPGQDEEVKRRIEQWQETVHEAENIPRLYVLMEILDMCIAWEKSVDNTNCRICKRKGNEATLLLCDGCDLGFHMGCLRIAVKDVPEGDWFCPSCAPPSERQTRNARSMKELSDSEDNSDESDETSSEEEEELCTICNKGGDVALCDTCLTGYHVSCHQPPLRAIPRFAWTCHACRFGTKMKKKKSKEKESNTDTAMEDSQVSTVANSNNKREHKTKTTRAKGDKSGSEQSKSQVGQSKRTAEKVGAKKESATRSGRTRGNVEQESDSENEVATKKMRSGKSNKVSKTKVRKYFESDSESELVTGGTQPGRAGRARRRAEESESDSDEETAAAADKRTRSSQSVKAAASKAESKSKRLQAKESKTDSDRPRKGQPKKTAHKVESAADSKNESVTKAARGGRRRGKVGRESDSETETTSHVRKSQHIRQKSAELSANNAGKSSKVKGAPAVSPARGNRVKSTRASPRGQSKVKPVIQDESADTTDASSSDDEVQLNLTQEQKDISEAISPSKRRRRSSSANDKDMKSSEDSKPKKEGHIIMEQLQQKLKTVHSRLWAHKSSWPFEYPINAEEVPDYYAVVSKPMDLTTISENMDSYTTAKDFVMDIQQMLINSFDYNPRESKVAKLTVEFEDYFVKMLSKHLPGAKYSKQQSLFGL